MALLIRVNPRNLSNVPGASTYGLKLPIRYIRRIAAIDDNLRAHLAGLASGTRSTYQRGVLVLWPRRAVAQFDGHISYTYTGLQGSSGAYSSQAHIAVTDSIWTPWITQLLGTSISAVYLEGNVRDFIVINAP